MTLKNSFFLVVLLLFLVSCDKKRVFDEYKTVGQNWHKDSIVSFTFEQKDTLTKQNLFINIRNNKNYPFNNLFLIVEMEHPSKKTLVDTLEYKMAKPDGTLLGEGLSDTKENKLFYKENFVFKNSGQYKVTIQQAVRQSGKIEGIEKLDGITEVGFRIEKQE
ncbi:gliding motility lipoprotein GldH [Flavobacterium sp.]|uniref:gliding motility lipoprotein GldH n=1 Tax=Flavobacterium sp. TaxID=239 RepID=UPI0025C38275|nr:gliding motility lipoprotein GldH [Flavobacterium sp.]MBA4152799.1 gliding motility lipoprotein GldH [Flavobacterium sp.]